MPTLLVCVWNVVFLLEREYRLRGYETKTLGRGRYEKCVGSFKEMHKKELQGLHGDREKYLFY